MIETSLRKKVCRQRIGDVQREISMQAKPFVAEKGDGSQIPNQDSIRSRILNQPEEPLLAGFLNSWSREESMRTLGNVGDGLRIEPDILEVDVNRCNPFL